MTGRYFDRLGIEYADSHAVKKCENCVKFVNPRIEGNVKKGFCRILQKIVWGMLTPQHNRDRLNREITDKCWIRGFSQE